MADSVEQVPDDLVRAKEMLRQVFGVMSIREVVIVDDEYSTTTELSDVIGAIAALINRRQIGKLQNNARLSGFRFSADSIWRAQVSDMWEQLNEQERRSLGESLDVFSEDVGAVESRSVLGRLLSDFELRFLTLQQWELAKDDLLLRVQSDPILFLFDLDMRKNQGAEDQGMKLIASLLQRRSVELPLYCGLFTNLATIENEHERHLTLASAHQLTQERDRFAVISKQHLHEQPSALAVGLKRVAISPWCEKVKTRLVNAVRNAVDDAAAKVGDLDIYDFEQIVFQSSYKEGVWEPDTLLRVFGLFHRESARRRARDDADLCTSADKIRSVIEVPYRPSEHKGQKNREIARMELYESAEYLISHRMPIDLGDIFQKTNGKKKFVLLEQPCDLMVRGDTGKRNADSVVMVELIEQAMTSQIRKSYVELEYYAENASNRCFADLASAFAVPIGIVDLCVFNPGGIAEIRVGDTCPIGMLHSWEMRFSCLQAEVKRAVEDFRKFSEGASPELREVLQNVFTKTVKKFVKGEIKGSPDRLEYPLRRIGRMKHPRSSSLLRELAFFRARDAFDHDLTRDVGHKASSVVESCNG
jgi:hypothetical protein